MKLRLHITMLTVSLLWIVSSAHVARAEGEDEPIRVVSFSIIDTKTQKPVKGYEKISKDDTIAISSLPTNKINVRANVSGKPGSVRFVVPEEKVNRVESKAPYSLAGDIYGHFLKWTAEPGTYTLTAVPYEVEFRTRHPRGPPASEGQVHGVGCGKSQRPDLFFMVMRHWECQRCFRDAGWGRTNGTCAVLLRWSRH